VDGIYGAAPRGAHATAAVPETVPGLGHEAGVFPLGGGGEVIYMALGLEQLGLVQLDIGRVCMRVHMCVNREELPRRRSTKRVRLCLTLLSVAAGAKQHSRWTAGG
jgi:hypothetical protein